MSFHMLSNHMWNNLKVFHSGGSIGRGFSSVNRLIMIVGSLGGRRRTGQ